METCNGKIIIFQDMGGFPNKRFRCASGAYMEIDREAKYCPNCGGMIVDLQPVKVEGRVAYMVLIPEIGWEIVGG